MGGGIGGILYSIRDNQPSFNWYNNRGDVIAKTSNTGELTYQAAYEAFGTRTQEQGETEDRQRANTREETGWGGLYENMRWRDLETGTYLTRDPLGFIDGPNMYAYVRQNPWSAFDPDGLRKVKVGEVYTIIDHSAEEIYVGEGEDAKKDGQLLIRNTKEQICFVMGLKSVYNLLMAMTALTH